MSEDVQQTQTPGLAAERKPTRSLGGSSLEISLPVRMLRQFTKNMSGMAGLVLVGLFALAALAAPLLTDADPADMDTTQILQAPSREHPFGTDALGRDVFSRVLYGARLSILVGVTVSVTTLLAGTTVGILAGYYPRLDGPFMRTMDLLMAFPGILLALAILAILGPQLVNIVIALAVVYTPRTARVARGMVLQLKDMEFTLAARSIGASDVRIMLRHLLPNSAAPIIVQQTYILALAILAEGAFTFLGIGVPPRTPTLGSIISEGRNHMRYAWWLMFFPGLTIAGLVLGFNLLGDGLRDVLDPQMKR